MGYILGKGSWHMISSWRKMWGSHPRAERLGDCLEGGGLCALESVELGPTGEVTGRQR